jgi:hypothetical protein
MRKIVTVAVLVTSVLGARAAQAREWEASGGATMHYLDSPGLDAASSSDEVTFGDLGLAVEVLRGLPFIDLVSVEARWQAGSTSANDFGLYDLQLQLDELEAGVRVAHFVHPRVRAFAHADLGGARGRLGVSLPYSTIGGLADTDWALAAAAGTGVDLAVYQQSAGDPDPDFAFGLRLELGYQVTGALAFAGTPEAQPTMGAPLGTRATPLGSLDADGAFVRIGVFGRW